MFVLITRQFPLDNTDSRYHFLLRTRLLQNQVKRLTPKTIYGIRLYFTKTQSGRILLLFCGMSTTQAYIGEDIEVLSITMYRRCHMPEDVQSLPGSWGVPTAPWGVPIAPSHIVAPFTYQCGHTTGPPVAPDLPPNHLQCEQGFQIKVNFCPRYTSYF